MNEHTVNNMLTTEERTMVRDLILLTYIDKMVSNSIREIEQSAISLKQIYIMPSRYLQERIIKDISELNKKLKQHNVRYEDDENDDFLLYYKIYYRGYQERFGMTRDVMRTEISLRLTRYTSEFGDIVKNIK